MGIGKWLMACFFKKKLSYFYAFILLFLSADWQVLCICKLKHSLFVTLATSINTVSVDTLGLTQEPGGDSTPSKHGGCPVRYF